MFLLPFVGQGTLELAGLLLVTHQIFKSCCDRRSTTWQYKGVGT